VEGEERVADGQTDFRSPLGFNFTHGKVRITGDGDTPLSFTTRSDMARYLAHVLTTLPMSELRWRTFRIEGDRTVRRFPLSFCSFSDALPLCYQTFNQIVEDYKARSGKKLDISHHPRSTLENALNEDPTDFLSLLLLMWDRGAGMVGERNNLANDVWPEWRPKKVLDVLL
jgi:hypothetical protein